MDKRIKHIDYLLMFILVINSGSPLLLNNDFIVGMSWLTVLLGSFISYIFYSNSYKINKSFSYYFFFFILLFFFHVLIFQFFPYMQIIGFIVKLIFGFFIVKVLNKNFFIVYVRIIYILTIISFIFYFPSLFFPSFKSFLFSIAISHPSIEFADTVKSLVVFNLNFGDRLTIVNYLRNSGPFWEPGAFAGYLLIALYFNTIINNLFFNKLNVVLIIGVLTTMSTTGYIALSFFIIYYLYSHKRLKYKLIIIPLILIISFLSFKTLPFLQEKLEKNIEKTENSDLRKDSRTRFASFIVDLKDLMTSPIVGRGISEQTRYVDYEKNGISNRNNGDSDFLIKFGLLGFIIYFISIYVSFKKISFYNKHIKYKNIALWGLSLVLIIGFSEGYFLQPFFMTLSSSAWIINYNN